ncbi:hypothetical protein M942_11675 [Enterobacter ludwigii]|nr:hypothetical protein M942_11675 [Enterobacter ludwigii]
MLFRSDISMMEIKGMKFDLGAIVKIVSIFSGRYYLRA